jgi:hypothetical protein
MLALTDEDGDGLWTGTTQAPNGDYVYLMATEANNTNLDIEDLSGESDEDENCAAATTEGEGDDAVTVWARPFMVQQMPIELEATYGSCGTCPPIHLSTGTIVWPDGEWQDVNGTPTLVPLPGSVEVIMTNFEDVGGFEFELPGTELDSEATPSGGAAETQSFTLDIGVNEKIVGYAAGGNEIAAGEDQILVQIPIDGLDNQGVCFDNVVFSDADGDPLDSQFTCQDGTPAAAYFSIGNIIAPTNSAEGSVEIMLTSHINVGGYQFEVSGLSLSNVNGGNVTGGLIDNLTQNSSLSNNPSGLIGGTQVSNGILIGWSMGDLVPSTDGIPTLFATLPISAIDESATEACLINEAVSDYIGNNATGQMIQCNPIP